MLKPVLEQCVEKDPHPLGLVWRGRRFDQLENDPFKAGCERDDRQIERVARRHRKRQAAAPSQVRFSVLRVDDDNRGPLPRCLIDDFGRAATTARRPPVPHCNEDVRLGEHGESAQFIGVIKRGGVTRFCIFGKRQNQCCPRLAEQPSEFLARSIVLETFLVTRTRTWQHHIKRHLQIECCLRRNAIRALGQRRDHRERGGSLVERRGEPPVHLRERTRKQLQYAIDGGSDLGHVNGGNGGRRPIALPGQGRTMEAMARDSDCQGQLGFGWTALHRRRCNHCSDELYHKSAARLSVARPPNNP